jgi:DNA polymerase/3'-5' exonuclease PolX
MNLLQASEIAQGIVSKLSPFCEKINIAGSIRRKKPDVRDIEIVCLPKTQIVNSSDLFGTALQNSQIDVDFILNVGMLGKIEKGSASGRYCKITLPHEIALDLFIPDAPDYYRQFAIRTGSADYSFKVIARGWRKIGWVGSDLGLRLEKDCVETKTPDGKSKWTCVRDKNNRPPIWQSEQEFFEWIKVPFISPELRNL